MKEFLLQSDIESIVERLKPYADRFEGKTIVLTGGKGFLGRYFADTFVEMNRVLLKKPVKVILIDNLITAGKFGEQETVLKNVEYHQHDIIKPFAYAGSVDYILHAAGIASPYYYRAFPLQTLDVAVQGTRNMLEMAKEKRAKFVFFSSSEIYGDPDAKYIPTTENYRGNVSCLGPRACYDESKRLGETLCRIFHQQFGTDTNMIRPFNVYGPGMQEKDYRVLPNFASRIKAGLPLNVYGNGNQTRTFCYVTDAIVGFLKVMLLGVPGEPYNIGNPTPEISMLQLVNEIKNGLGREVKLNTVDYPDSYPADEPNRRCPDITKAQLQLDYHPQVSLKAGLDKFMGWALENYTGEL